MRQGVPLDEEGLECLGVRLRFPPGDSTDAVVAVFGDPVMVQEMDRVFFSEGTNRLGHSYAKLMRGPDGRHDLLDVVRVLREKASSKRAVVTFATDTVGKVPCINNVQFLIRGGELLTVYFSRGQDAYKKFYADALCLGTMARKVAGELDLPTGQVTAFISSSHVYRSDFPAIERFLSEASAEDVAAPGPHATSPARL